MRKIFWFGAFLFFILSILFFVRAFSEKQLDDVSSSIPCDNFLLDKVDVYYVIPSFKGENNSLNLEWCRFISSKRKKLAMHGVYHWYREFGVYRDRVYVQKGLDEFERCFGFEPREFKPPNLAWTRENDWMKRDFNVKGFWNQVFHKVYHCNDSGRFPNWFIDLF